MLDPVKKLIVVATKIQDGRGGISSALSGYLNGLDRKGVDYELVESHGASENMFITWLKAFWTIACLSYKYRGGKAVFWFHCAQWLSMFRKFSLAIIPRLFACETLGHIHSPAFSDYLSSSGATRSLTKISLLPYTQLIMLTPWWKSLLEQHGITASAFVSPNPNSDKYCQVAECLLDKNRTIDKCKSSFAILTMARLVEGKGVEVVIEALAKLPKHFTLTVAGDGDKRVELEALVEQLGLAERVEFTGWINGEQKETLLRKADLFCLPSTYDSFGMVFIEAMAFDLPVVAYGWGPIVDVVTTDVGVCCSSPTVDNVKAAITDVCDDLGRFSGAGPKKVLSQYTADIAATNIANLLK